MESTNMKAQDLPDTLPEHLRTEANATFLHQVHLDMIEEGTEPTEENILKAMKARLERNQEIAQTILDAEGA